jgi:hypothetical protein
MKLKLLVAMIGFIPVLAVAQTAPSMLGTWKIDSASSTVLGKGAHHPAKDKKDSEIRFTKPVMTLVIDRQEGANFAGTLSSGSHKEIILGAIAPDLQGGVMVDEDGTHTFKIVNANTIQNCYVQMAKPKLAACWTGKRQ